MSTSKIHGPAIAAVAMLLGLSAVGGAATAAPLASAKAADQTHSAVQPVRHGRWGGVGIYVGPSYGYYDDDYYGYDYYPRRSYYYRDRYDRPYRTHSRRWVKERFHHPLGRR